MSTIIPTCKWAQRKERVYVTADVTDAKDVKVVFEDKKVSFHGKLKDAEFGHTFNLFAEISPEESSYKVLGRELQINLKKKDTTAGYWDRLTEEPSKASKTFLSCDWDRWVDEDEDAGEVPDFGYGGEEEDDEDADLDDLGPDEHEPGCPHAHPPGCGHDHSHDHGHEHSHDDHGHCHEHGEGHGEEADHCCGGGCHEPHDEETK